MSCREEILAVIRDVVRHRSNGIFTVNEVQQAMRARRSRFGSATIGACMASTMCTDAPQYRKWHYDDLERVGRGQYRLKKRRSIAAD